MNAKETQASPDLPIEYDLNGYDFELPEKLIAQTPAETRQESRLLILDRSRDNLRESGFSSLADLLPENALLVTNNTKVLPARLIGRKATGGKVEFLMLTPIALIQEEAADNGWKRATVRGLLKASKGPRVGDTVDFGPDLRLTVREKREFGQAAVDLFWKGDLVSLFMSQGHIPLPPYIRREDRAEDRERYQTLYSREDKLGSVAAPTAGLHFTPDVLDALTRKNITRAEVTLYVGYGTFSPIRCRDIREHAMHSEYIEIPPDTAEAVATAKAEGRPVVAVGTTSTRALESMVRATGGIHPYAGWTDIFISPGYRFQVIDHLITNFHLPRSSLIIMISALAGRERVLAAYRHAVKEEFRFFSYGDAMLIL
jgi:S-adenosylmethionine:tRNA ribosyltransferase-isomerase